MRVTRLVLHLLPSVSPASVQCGRHGRHMPFVVYTLWLEKNPILLVAKDISQGETIKNMFYLSTSKGSDDWKLKRHKRLACSHKYIKISCSHAFCFHDEFFSKLISVYRLVCLHQIVEYRHPTSLMSGIWCCVFPAQWPLQWSTTRWHNLVISVLCIAPVYLGHGFIVLYKFVCS